ncbi:MAG: OmpA family protein, partial [Bacteroidales bacterium]|nr:OmpA family protein [Bacteroidales bacterium]
DIPEVWFHINFVVDKWDISKRELINLQSIADLIKSTPNTKYLVCGYADKQTATPDHNMMLSENRANAVYDVLVNQFGVPASQIVKDFKGGVDYMFYNEKELSRCVMINSIKE